jgi:hypothetical protein
MSNRYVVAIPKSFFDEDGNFIENSPRRPLNRSSNNRRFSNNRRSSNNRRFSKNTRSSNRSSNNSAHASSFSMQMQQEDPLVTKLKENLESFFNYLDTNSQDSPSVNKIVSIRGDIIKISVKKLNEIIVEFNSRGMVITDEWLRYISNRITTLIYNTIERILQPMI